MHGARIGHILVPRGRAPFGQHQESRPLARSNTGSPRFTDFPSLCACSESSLTNLIGSDLNLLCLQSHSKPECRWDSVGIRSRFLVLTKRSAVSGDENGIGHSQLALMRIRYHFIADLHITETQSILFLTKYDKNNIAHSKTGCSVID